MAEEGLWQSHNKTFNISIEEVVDRSDIQVSSVAKFVTETIHDLPLQSISLTRWRASILQWYSLALLHRRLHKCSFQPDSEHASRCAKASAVKCSFVCDDFFFLGIFRFVAIDLWAIFISIPKVHLFGLDLANHWRFASKINWRH